MHDMWKQPQRSFLLWSCSGWAASLVGGPSNSGKSSIDVRGAIREQAVEVQSVNRDRTKTDRS